jgi:hypothetical protein
MINPDAFIFETDIDINLEKIKKIVFETQFSLDKNLSAGHHRIVSNHPYLKELQSQYPFLSDIYNIYTLPGKRNIPLHVDSQRSAALNIPINNTQDSHTIFYEYDEDPVLEYDSKNIFNLIRSRVKEVFRFTLLKPTLINNSVPHMVVNNSLEPRVILSWSINKEFNFKYAKDRLQ